MKIFVKKIRRSKSWVVPTGMTEKEAFKEAQKLAEIFEKEIKENISYGLRTGDYTVESYSKIYIEYLKKTFSPSYYTRSINIFDYMNKKIGNIKLTKLNPAIIQNYFDEVDKDKKVFDNIYPVKKFNEILEAYGFNYHILRYEKNIQHFTLRRAFNGGKVKKVWADTLCEKTKIPFDEIFYFKRELEEYSYNTKKKRKIYLRQLLAYAKRQRVIKENYATADYVTYTRDNGTKEIMSMDEQQAKIFYETLLTYPDIRIKTSLLIFLLTGFRRGEVTGLRWDDIDFETNKISIKRTVLDTTGLGIIIKEPKTKKSARTITMPDILANQLKEYKNWQSDNNKRLGDFYHNENWLFTQDNGKNIHPETFLFWLRKVLDKAELPRFTIHSLRHTNITLQIAAGVPLITVSGRAGHSRTSTTTDIYSHFIQSSDGVAA